MEKPPLEVSAPPQDQGYPPQGQGYPPQGPGYPPQGQGYPPQGSGYPPQGQGYPPQGQGYPPQGQGAPPQSGPAATTVVVTQPVAVVPVRFTEAPLQMTCTNCHAHIITSTRYETGTFAYVIAAILCLIGCWPCCLIPLFVDGCKDVHHSCPNCKTELGSMRRM